MKILNIYNNLDYQKSESKNRLIFKFRFDFFKIIYKRKRKHVLVIMQMPPRSPEITNILIAFILKIFEGKFIVFFFFCFIILFTVSCSSSNVET